ncbi:MAG TPA: SxtJ family membrane protein [Bacteroidota bacterium]|nr:SxtJ family membrane protein [Bacteroidota bacterium]
MIERVDASKKNVRNFGLLFGGICLGLALYSWIRGGASYPWWVAAGIVFALSGLLAAPLLRPLYTAWMLLAFALGWINTRVLLGIFFYIVLTPISLILRWTGKDLLDQRIERGKPTYWKKRNRRPVEPARLERMF